MNLLRVVSLVLCIAIVCSTEPAHAQKKQQRNRQVLQERANQAKTPPEMPGITFPNGKFLYGYRKDEGRGQVMGARFQVPDSSSNVIAYYRSALQSSGWTINPASHDKNMYATNTRLGATVTVQTFNHPPGCDVYFSYAMKR
ncbi:MAG: hypothetical protein K2X77_13520 [Candidatus Obscuribacterales bacterium]|jgi:hypothetical protein|nr:hypothetical protein [Candidatus Obscuribacterales bacterium]